MLHFKRESPKRQRRGQKQARTFSFPFARNSILWFLRRRLANQIQTHADPDSLNLSGSDYGSDLVIWHFKMESEWVFRFVAFPNNVAISSKIHRWFINGGSRNLSLPKYLLQTYTPEWSRSFGANPSRHLPHQVCICFLFGEFCIFELRFSYFDVLWNEFKVLILVLSGMSQSFFRVLWMELISFHGLLLIGAGLTITVMNSSVLLLQNSCLPKKARWVLL